MHGDPVTKRLITVAFILTITAGAVIALAPLNRSHTGAGEGFEMPPGFGNWKKEKDIVFEERVHDILGADSVSAALYRNSENRAVTLVAVHAANNRSAFHPPEYCLRGSGFELVERSLRRSALPGRDGGRFGVNEMVFSGRHGEKLFAWNWYMAGNAQSQNFYFQQLLLLRDQIVSGRGNGAVFNIYTDMEDNDTESAREAVKDFAGKFVLETSRCPVNMKRGRP